MNLILALAISLLLSIIIITLLRLRKLKLHINKFIGIGLFISIISGFYLINHSSDVYNQYNQFAHWQTVQGVIKDTQVTGERAKLPEITYEYKVDEKTFLGKSNLSAPGFGNKRFRDQTAQNILKDYKSGEKITVHINPDDHSKSVIIVKTPWNIFMQFGLGIILLTIAFSLSANFLMKSKQE